MGDINKRPQVIRDLIELATYMATDNLDASDRMLAAAEKTFRQLAKLPGMGKICQFSHPRLADVRQQAIKGFRNYLVFYRPTASGVEILRLNRKLPVVKSGFKLCTSSKLGKSKLFNTAAVVLGRERVTVQRWLRQYRTGGLVALLKVHKSKGRPQIIPGWAIERLQQELKDPEGFASYAEVKTWLEAELGIEANYHVVL